MAEPDHARESRGGDQKFDWKPILQVLAIVAGSAVWVQLIGSLDMWARFNKIGIAHTSTVALLPKDLLFATGVRALTLPVLAGVVACGALVLWHAQKERRVRQRVGAKATVPRNPSGGRPPGLRTTFLAILVIAFALVLWAPLTAGVTVLLLCLLLSGTALIYSAVACTTGFGSAAAAVLVGTAFLGGVVGLVLQYFAEPTLDVAVVIRKNDPPLSGFYIGRTGDAVYLLTATQPGAPPDPFSDVPKKECRDNKIPNPRMPQDCYVEQVVGVRTDDVSKFAIGPRTVEVDAAGYNWARWLARALVQPDAVEAPP